MTDRDLLELAAKAAGMWVNDFSLDDDYQPFFHDERGFRLAWGKGWWNPITDDGDALRLAVKLDLFWEQMELFDIYMDNNPHEPENVRRAIVRAAAEIGKAS